MPPRLNRSQATIRVPPDISSDAAPESLVSPNSTDPFTGQTDSQKELPDEPFVRFINTCLTSYGDHTVVDAKTSLGAKKDYELRIDIGRLSPKSVVQNAPEKPFPSERLPETTHGHWLEAIVVSDDFTIPIRRHHLFLPKIGPSWVCACPPGSDHICTIDTRSSCLFIPLRSPQNSGTARLRISLYYQKNLLQSQLLTAEITEVEREGNGYGAWIDYTLTATLGDISYLPPRTVNILTNHNADGTHKIMINGPESDLAFNLTEGQMGDTVQLAREALRQVHFTVIGGHLGSKKQRENLYHPRNNSKNKKDFVADLAKLAQHGQTLWLLLLEGEEDWWETLLEPSMIQVARVVGSRFVFPWALLYDIPLAPDEDYELCPLLQEWDSAKSLLRDTSLRRCPFESEHEPVNFLCPFGFWGFKHSIEQLPSMPRGWDLPLEISITNQPPDMVMGLSLALDNTLTNHHINKLKELQFRLIACDSRAKFAETLVDPHEVIYFYCHGRGKSVPGISQQIPLLEIGRDEPIEPSHITTWRRAKWPKHHWKATSPLIFINGCHTVEITPETLLTFVDTFSKAYAAGVLGTEITVDQAVASEAGEAFFKHFQNQETVGEALHQMRLHFLEKGNLLGLAYTAYCSASLKLVKRDGQTERAL
ncbi:MAG TPA: hypothetical protein VFZ66_27510 [Herpetosiphonaceae bacterium]